MTRGLEVSVVAPAGKGRLDVTFTARTGATLAIVGPNGAGKTTLLRTVAGLHPLSAGSVVLDGEALHPLPPEARPLGMVFQDHRLFPHLSALDNVAFALRARGLARAAARRRALDWLERLEVAGSAGALPAALSGGQAQRVALARALATEPRLLLLDEPLSALDAGAAPGVRRLLRRELAQADAVQLLVTHDPREALALATDLVVLEDGKVTQAGPVDDFARRPRSAYAAELVGLNLLAGRMEGDRVVATDGSFLVTAVPVPSGSQVIALVHPRAVSLYRREPHGSPRNVWPGRVAGWERGVDPDDGRVRICVEGQFPLVAEITASAARDLQLSDGVEVWVAVKASEVDVYPA